jgi:hypothetical protein
MKFNLNKTYLAVIASCKNITMFQRIYFFDGKKNINIVANGRLSCAAFVSYVLKLFALISAPHVTVKSTLIDLKNNGWYKIKRPKPGAIIHWSAGPSSNKHEHLGFCLNGGLAISNSSKKHCPIIHSLKKQKEKPAPGRSQRAIKAFYWHKKLNVIR